MPTPRAPTPPRLAPPPPVPPPPRTIESHASQPNPTRNVTPDTHSLLATLEKFRADQTQTTPPRARANPSRGGAPHGGGRPEGAETGGLTGAQRGAIGDHVRECWSYDAGAQGASQFRVLLDVVTDGGGTVHDAHVSGSDVGRLGDPVFRAYAERAVRAVLDPRCATLPLPQTMLGQNRSFVFRFSP